MTLRKIRTVDELRRLILPLKMLDKDLRKRLIVIVRESKSPNEVAEKATKEIDFFEGDIAWKQATINRARFLAVLKRDYGLEAFEEISKEILDCGQNGEGVMNGEFGRKSLVTIGR